MSGGNQTVILTWWQDLQDLTRRFLTTNYVESINMHKPYPIILYITQEATVIINLKVIKLTIVYQLEQPTSTRSRAVKQPTVRSVT